MSRSVISVNKINKTFIINRDKESSVRSVFANLFSNKPKNNTNHQLTLSDITFSVEEGDFFGLVGRNGSGKSTLLKIIAGIYQPSSGTVEVDGRLVPFIELGVGFNPELTARENVFLNGAMLGFSRVEIDSFYKTVVDFAELDNHMDKKLKNYSSGMQVRLAFSIAIQADADILLVDEVLAVGDSAFKKKCYKYFDTLKDNNKTVIFVTHDMSMVERYCNKAILLDKNTVIESGSPSAVASSYRRLFANNLEGPGRLGSGVASYTNIDVKTHKNTINVNTTLRVTEDTDYINAGMSISRAGGSSILLGTNTDIKEQRLEGLKKGAELNMDWSIPNIFNNGEYVINLAAVSRDGLEKYDWWDYAAKFTINNKPKTPYPLSPDIDLVTTFKEGGEE